MKKSLKSMSVLSLLVFFCAYGVQSIAANEKQIKQSEYAYYTQLAGNLQKDNITIKKYPRQLLTQWTLELDDSVVDSKAKAIFVLAPMSEEATPAPEALPTFTPAMGASPAFEDGMFKSGNNFDFVQALATPTPQTFRFFGMSTPSPQANMYQFEGAFPTPAPTPPPDAEYSLSQFTTAMPDLGFSSPLPLQMTSPRPTPTMARAQDRRRLFMPTTTPRRTANPTPRPTPAATATPDEDLPLSLLIQLSTPVPEEPSEPEDEQFFYLNPPSPAPNGASNFNGLPTMTPSPEFLFPGDGNGFGDGDGNGDMMNTPSPRGWKPTKTPRVSRVPRVRPTVTPTPMSLF